MRSALVLCAKDCWRLSHTRRRYLYGWADWPLGQVERRNSSIDCADVWCWMRMSANGQKRANRIDLR